MELRHLRYFVAVAEEGNLTRAAEKLFIAQPPLTRAMKQLEEEIGVELFIRKPRGLELTNGGEYFLEQARQILDKVTATVDDTRRIAQHRKTIFFHRVCPIRFLWPATSHGSASAPKQELGNSPA